MLNDVIVLYELEMEWKSLLKYVGGVGGDVFFSSRISGYVLCYVVVLLNVCVFILLSTYCVVRMRNLVA